MAAGKKKIKTDGLEKNEKEGKGGKGKKRLKNASLRVKNSKNLAGGGQLPPCIS